MRSNSVRAVALLAATAAAAVAVAAPASATPTGRKTVSIRVSKSHTVTMTDSVRPGLVRLHNASARFIEIYGRRHSDLARLVKDRNSSFNSDGPGRLVKDFTVVGFLMPHSYAYLPLTSGTYYLLDGDADKIKASQVHTLAVHGSKVNAKAPSKSAPVIVKPNGSLYASPTLPRSGYVHFINRAEAVHETLIIGVGKSVSDKTVQNFLAKPTLEDLFGDLAPRTIDIAGLGSTGRGEYLPFHNSAGRYVLADLSFTATSKHVSLRKNGVRLSYVK